MANETTSANSATLIGPKTSLIAALRTTKPSALAGFLGKKVLILLFSGIFLGFILFGVELVFAFTLQVVLSRLGAIAAPESNQLSWLPSFQTFEGICVFLLIVGLARSFLNFMQAYVQGLTTIKVEELFLRRALHRIFFNERDSSASLQRTLVTAGNCGLFVSCTQGVLFNTVLVAFLWLSLFKLMPLNTVFLSIAMVALFLPAKKIDQVITQAGVTSLDSQGTIQNRVFRSIKNFILLKIYGMQRRELDTTLRTLEKGANARKTYIKLLSVKFAFPQAVGIVVLTLLIVMIHRSGNANAQSLAFFYLFIRAVQTLSTINQNLGSLSFNKVDFFRLYHWWRDYGYDSPSVKNRLTAAQVAPNHNSQNYPLFGWNLKDVHFSYSPEDTFAIRGLSAAFPPGRCVVIMGPSGAGKSTILNLLLGMLQPKQGSIEVLSEGNVLPKSDPIPLTAVGYVGPEPFLIEGTILENLLYGSDGSALTNSQIENALQLAECQFVHTFREKLNHRINEQGEGLSAGQKQRLALARALLRAPRVLVLDEVTANLDAATEAKIIETLKHLKGKMTIICVTHRQALLEIADQVLSIDAEGKIQISGTSV